MTELDLSALEDEIAGQIARDRSLISKQEKEIAALREELKEERKQSLKARMQAVASMENTTIEALQRVLTEERKAREAAEKRAMEGRPVVVEKVEQLPPHPWRIVMVARDANGFGREWEVTPK